VCVYIYIYIYKTLCVCVCVCVYTHLWVRRKCVWITFATRWYWTGI